MLSQNEICNQVKKRLYSIVENEQFYETLKQQFYIDFRTRIQNIRDDGSNILNLSNIGMSEVNNILSEYRKGNFTVGMVKHCLSLIEKNKVACEAFCDKKKQQLNTKIKACIERFENQRIRVLYDQKNFACFNFRISPDDATEINLSQDSVISIVHDRLINKDKDYLESLLICMDIAYGALGNTQKAYKAYERASSITNKQTPLHLAAKNGNIETVKYFLAKGLDILAKNNHDTVLHQAVSSGNEEVIRLILDKIKEKDSQNFFEHINVKDTEGDTPLMWAAKNGKTNAAKILLEYGADPNVKNDNGETALHWAAKGSYQEVLQLLLNKQADPNIQDKNGKTPLDLAQEKLTQDPENDNLKKIIGLPLSVRTCLKSFQK